MDTCVNPVQAVLPMLSGYCYCPGAAGERRCQVIGWVNDEMGMMVA